MSQIDSYCKNIFSIDSPEKFEESALFAFKYQFDNNPIYKEFCRHLGVIPENVKSINNVPFLPVSFFKSHQIINGSHADFTVFYSSSTTSDTPSKHYVSDIDVYKNSFLRAFKIFYGLPSDYTIIALLPSYLEREGSSLIYMVNELILLSGKEESGFFLNNYEKLSALLQKLEKKQSKYLLIGVSFALLDFAEKHKLSLKNGIVMETGGMKGRRKEIVREELHSILKKAFDLYSIHSEYGMTELLSQAYSKENGIYFCPPWMKVFARNTEDPLSVVTSGTGALNIIDLANINSCCFIATSDLGTIYPNGSFEVSGRYDFSDVRGCNLMTL